MLLEPESWGTKVARKNRAKCNRLSKLEREKLQKKAFALIYEDDDEEIFTDMPTKCLNWKCADETLFIKNGFVTCPKCGGSYGKK